MMEREDIARHTDDGRRTSNLLTTDGLSAHEAQVRIPLALFREAAVELKGRDLGLRPRFKSMEERMGLP